MLKKIKTIKINNSHIRLFIPASVFFPTATTNFLIRDAKKFISKNADILDLGCGSGIIAILANKLQTFVDAKGTTNLNYYCVVVIMQFVII